MDALCELLNGRETAVRTELCEQITDAVEDWLDSSIPGSGESFFSGQDRLLRLTISGASAREVNQHPESDAALSRR